MSQVVHQSAIHFLRAHQPDGTAQRLRVEALIAQHERECAEEVAKEAAAGDLTCQECKRKSCSYAATCPARQPRNS